jgi:hypothetical protein
VVQVLQTNHEADCDAEGLRERHRDKIETKDEEPIEHRLNDRTAAAEDAMR